VAKTVMPEIRVDEQLTRLLKNPAQLEALVFLIEGPASKSDVAKELGIRLNKADYDVRQLEKMGLVEAIGTELRRGIRTNIYRAVMRPVWNNAEWADLSQDDRERYVLWTQQLLLRDMVMAWHAKTFQARAESHTSRAPLRVDELGWIKLNEIQDDALTAGREVEVESIERAREAGDESKLINVRAAMFCFEMPSSNDLPK
jgi:DNA-binding transcriptional ArsR family regulator